MTPPALALSTLKAARDLLADPLHWTRNVLARDSEGTSCDPLSHRACSWCLDGALRKVDQSGAFLIARDELLRTVGVSFQIAIRAIAHFNDEHGHQDVIDLIDRTIERLSP